MLYSINVLFMIFYVTYVIMHVTYIIRNGLVSVLVTFIGMTYIIS